MRARQFTPEQRAKLEHYARLAACVMRDARREVVDAALAHAHVLDEGGNDELDLVALEVRDITTMLEGLARRVHQPSTPVAPVTVDVPDRKMAAAGDRE